MATIQIQKKSDTASAAYTRLREQVRETLLEGQLRVEQARVQTYCETGKLIEKHLQQNIPEGKERAAYNKRIVEKLAEDLDLAESLLYRCVRFFQQFKKVAARQLSWSHYRALLSIPDEDTRLELADQAGNKEWTSRELELEIKKINERMRGSNGAVIASEPKQSPTELLTPRQGQVYTYRVIRPELIVSGKTDLRLDLGFSSYWELSEADAKKLKEGSILQSVQTASPRRYTLSAVRATPNDLFTYHAYVERVVDGDTLLVQVDLGFGIWTRQYLRLRGIDCPEIDTSEGKKAKRFVETELKDVSFITITSSRSDKYDRYLADVFYAKSGHSRGSGNPEAFYLNNELLQRRLAVRMN